MKRSTRKLALGSETVRTLTSPMLSLAQGAEGTPSASLCASQTPRYCISSIAKGCYTVSNTLVPSDACTQ